MSVSALASPARIAVGTPEFRRVNVAVFSCGFSIFAILYCTQPVLPQLAREFAVTPAQSSLALSLTTITMAVAMLVASSISEVVGRKPPMVFALVGSALLTLALAAAPDWNSLLWLRALAGVTLSGAPAVTIAYLGEEMEKTDVPRAVGIYIGGGALGGMSGRLAAAFLADHGSWRWAMAGLGALGLASAIVFWRLLPPSRHFKARTFNLPALAASMAALSRRPAIALLVLEGFILLGGYMAVFNFLGFRLQAPPFNLSQSAAGLVFLVYPIGSYASAFMGGLAGRVGRGRALCLSISIMIAGLIAMTPDNLIIIAAGLATMTFGFFGAHAISSGWAPSLTERDKAQASSLYLLLYYIGGGVAGSYAGVFWTSDGWTGVALYAGALMAATLCAAATLWRVAPSR
jgi:YNFM family putative membrane transporter